MSDKHHLVFRVLPTQQLVESLRKIQQMRKGYEGGYDMFKRKDEERDDFLVPYAPHPSPSGTRREVLVTLSLQKDQKTYSTVTWKPDKSLQKLEDEKNPFSRSLSGKKQVRQVILVQGSMRKTFVEWAEGACPA